MAVDVTDTFPVLYPTKVLLVPVVKFAPALYPKIELKFPVVILFPDSYPIATDLKSPVATLACNKFPLFVLFVSDSSGEDSFICFIDTTIVPSKKVLGVIVRLPVVDALGPNAPEEVT